MVPEPIPRLDERYFADLLQIRCKGRADVVRGERSPKHRLWPNAHAGRPSRRGRSKRVVRVAVSNPRTGELDGIKTRAPLCAYARRSLQPSRRSAEAVDTTPEARPGESAKGSSAVGRRSCPHGTPFNDDLARYVPAR